MQNSWVKYSGLAVQFVLFILFGYWAGKWLGQVAGWNETYCSLSGMLFFLVTGMVKLIRDVLKENQP
jgi:hypothetical protein